MNRQPSAPLHPLLKVAAGSVIVASAVVVASFTGLLPRASAPEPMAVVAPAPAMSATEASVPVLEALPPPAAGAVAVEAVPAPKPKGAVIEPEPVVVVKKPKLKVAAYNPPTVVSPPAPVKAPELCYSCGTVQAVNVVTEAGQASGVGAVSGAVLGGVAGHQMGKGRGKDAMTVVGVIGGALAGNAAEKAIKKTQYYEVSVRMEGGDVQTFSFQTVPPFSSGDAVRVEGGQLMRRY
jgi:outer membrane lipoprotein SlyB